MNTGSAYQKFADIIKPPVLNIKSICNRASHESCRKSHPTRGGAAEQRRSQSGTAGNKHNDNILLLHVSPQLSLVHRSET